MEGILLDAPSMAVQRQIYLIPWVSGAYPVGGVAKDRFHLIRRPCVSITDANMMPSPLMNMVTLARGFTIIARRLWSPQSLSLFFKRILQRLPQLWILPLLMAAEEVLAEEEGDCILRNVLSSRCHLRLHRFL